MSSAPGSGKFQILTTFYEVNCATIVFVSLWLLVSLCVRYGILQPYVNAIRYVIKCNSWLYSAASLVLLITMVSTSDENEGTGNSPSTLRYAYHLSKFYEYLDVLFVRATCVPIDLHFGFHHLTTPYLTLIRVVQSSSSWRIGAMLNAAHHVLMYAFFGGAQILRPALPWTGTLQLVVGLTIESILIRNNWMMGDGRPVWPNITTACLLFSYLILFTRDLILRRASEKSMVTGERVKSE